MNTNKKIHPICFTSNEREIFLIDLYGEKTSPEKLLRTNTNEARHSLIKKRLKAIL